MRIMQTNGMVMRPRLGQLYSLSVNSDKMRSWTLPVPSCLYSSSNTKLLIPKNYVKKENNEYGNISIYLIFINPQKVKRIRRGRPVWCRQWISSRWTLFRTNLAVLQSLLVSMLWRKRNIRWHVMFKRTSSTIMEM